MNKRILLYFATALLTAGCSSEADLATNSPSGEGKTPLTITATLTTARPGTRAEGKKFETNDQLLVYLRHTTGGTSVGSYTYVTPVPSPDYANQLITFKKGSVEMGGTDSDETWETSDLTSSAYWDDFSNSTSEATDLRTTGHGLQSYYGYCYNGGTPSTALDKAAGTLGWTVGATVTPEGGGASYVDQTTAEKIKKADLLWSPSQPTVTYAHSTAHSGDHGILTIPFTHAMSMVTVTLRTTEGFVPEGTFTGVTNPMTNTTVTLNSVNTQASLTAPTGGFTSTESKNIRMCKGAYPDTSKPEGPYSCDFTAIIAPGTPLTAGSELLNIRDVDGNNYTVKITNEMLDAQHWGSTNAQPGYNYHLDVEVKKVAVQTKATLTEWKSVTASGKGEVYFDDDETNLIMDDAAFSGVETVNVMGVDKNKFANGASFSLFTLKAVNGKNVGEGKTYETRPNDTDASYTGYNLVTVASFVNNTGDVEDEWTTNPKLFWLNGTDNFYFRALAKFVSSTGSGDEIVNNIQDLGLEKSDAVALKQGTIAAGRDILWGVTAKHKGTTSNRIYNLGAPIPPRTGGVPIAFIHAMSKVTFNLETTNDAEVTNNNAKVDLTGFTIAISNLYTNATIRIDDGGIIYPDAVTTAAINNQDAPITDYIVIPQDISDDAKVTITLPNQNNAVYTIKLKDCLQTGTTSPVISWERGKQYTYTIHIEKEKIQFRALVKDWDAPVNVSGEANLEWD